MISLLRGIIGKESPGQLCIDVHGVGYKVSVPVSDWDDVQETHEATFYISTYVREDRFDLYGFLQRQSRELFERLTDISGIGPRTGLELCAVPRGMLAQAVHQKDPAILTSVKGIGRKSAEKLLVELSSIMEKSPELFSGHETLSIAARFDRDAVAALSQLGFQSDDIVRALESLPAELETTEERVTAALRSL